MAGQLSSLADKTVKDVSTSEDIVVDSFWREQACVVTFLRRFGCPYCRIGAQRLDAVSPVLRDHNVRLIGVGPEDVGATEFVEGKFFSGELYVDNKKMCYKELGYKRLCAVSALAVLFSKKFREGYEMLRKIVGGNLKGDSLQLGGTIVVARGGELLLNHVQLEPTAYVDNGDVLEALGLPRDVAGQLPLPQHLAANGCTSGSCNA